MLIFGDLDAICCDGGQKMALLPSNCTFFLLVEISM